MTLRLLISGASGQVGWQLQRTLAPLGEVIALDRKGLDLADPESAARKVRELRPDVLVNAAAYTAVDKAESEPELARLINAVSPSRMAEELVRSGGLMVHYSTDYVFDGSKTGPYEEDDPVAPLNVYGQTKFEGEQGIRVSGGDHVILRTSWVYDIRGKNFLRTVLRLGRERPELRMVSDQRGAPTWARAIAEATAVIVAHYPLQLPRGDWPLTGTYHLTAAGETTWAAFAEAILEDYESYCCRAVEMGESAAPLLAKRVVPISSAEFPTPARRPSNSLLCNHKLTVAFGLALPDWRQLLRLAMLDTVR